MDPFWGPIVILGSTAIAALTTVAIMAILGLDDTISVLSAIVTWPLWILFWRSEVVLPIVLSRGSYTGVGGLWWLLWAVLYGIAFLIWFRIAFKRWV